MQDSETGRQILQDKPRVTVHTSLHVSRCHAVLDLAPGYITLSWYQPLTTILWHAVLQNEAVAHAWDMEEGTFGQAYARFMGDRNFLAGDRPPVRFIDDAELAYVAARAREVHDFWHVLFGCHTNVFGELALKAVELVQVT